MKGVKRVPLLRFDPKGTNSAEQTYPRPLHAILAVLLRGKIRFK